MAFPIPFRTRAFSIRLTFAQGRGKPPTKLALMVMYSQSKAFLWEWTLSSLVKSTLLVYIKVLSIKLAIHYFYNGQLIANKMLFLLFLCKTYHYKRYFLTYIQDTTSRKMCPEFYPNSQLIIRKSQKLILNPHNFLRIPNKRREFRINSGRTFLITINSFWDYFQSRNMCGVNRFLAPK